MHNKEINTATPENRVRQLAAIMFTDMTGYTAMMQEDERKAKLLGDRQRQTLEKLIPSYHGKIPCHGSCLTKQYQD